MSITAGNLFADLPADRAAEQITALFAAPGVRIERIVSHGQASPEGFWYDQDGAEWVIVLAGAARLSIEGEAASRELRPGDCLLLPSHLRHRVEWTAPDTATVWLAVHVG